jgi:hypothetical protein
MTMPAERTRALRFAGEFLNELRESGELSEKRTREVISILRHYPSMREIAHQARYGHESRVTSVWLAPED